MHALWTLDVLGGLDAEELVARRSTIPSPGPRAGREAGRGPARRRLRRAREPLLALADDPDPMVRFQAAFSLGDVRRRPARARRPGGDRRRGRGRPLDPRGRAQLDRRPVAELIDAPGAARRASSRAPAGRVWLDELAVLVGAENQPDDVEAVLDRFAGPDADPGLTRAVVLGLGRGLQRAGGSLRERLDRASVGDGSRPSFARAARGRRGGRARHAAGRRDPAAGPRARSTGRSTVLPDLLDARAADRASSSRRSRPWPTSPTAASARAIVEHWKALSPSVRREAVEVLFARPERLDALLDALESKTVAASDLDPARHKQLARARRPAIRGRAEKLLGSARPRATGARSSPPSAPPSTLDGRPRARGAAVFKKVCATCHRAEGQGRRRRPEPGDGHRPDARGPARPHPRPQPRGRADLPQLHVATTDGRVLSGLIAEESANAVTLKRAEGATDVVPRDRIETIASTGLSLMPEGLEKGPRTQGPRRPDRLRPRHPGGGTNGAGEVRWVTTGPFDSRIGA